MTAILIDDAVHGHTSNTYDELMRAQWIGADVDLAWRVKVSKEAFAFTTLRSYVVADAMALADSFHDYGGQRVLWGVTAQDVDGMILRLWNSATWGGASAWYYAVDDGDAHALAGGLTVGEHTRPGVIALGAGTFIVFAVDASGVINAKLINVAAGTATWGNNYAGALSLGSVQDAVVVCPIGPADPYIADLWVLSLDDALFYAQRHHYSSGSWTSGHKTPLVHNASLIWVDGLNGNAEQINGTDVLVIPAGPDGQNMIVTHTLPNANLTSGIFSTPHFILASPGQEMGRRVWVNGLSQLNGRLWATVWNALEGDPDFLYAHHLSLLSSPNGVHWRDEGYISQLDMRGKLLQVGTDLWLVSATTVLTMPALARFAQPDAAASTWLTAISGLNVTHSGQRATAELRITAMPGATLEVVPGMRVEYDLGARVGTDENGDPAYAYIRQFTGFVDQPVMERTLGGAGEEWLCRGVLGGMIGENAYRPPTSLWFPGRRVFNTHFLEYGEPVEALAALTGYWLAIKVDALPPYDEYGYLACGTSGLAVVPVTWEWPDLVCTMECSTPKSLGFVFWDTAEDADYGIDCFEVGIVGTQLWFTRRQTGAATLALAAYNLSNYASGDRVKLTLSLGPGRVGVTFADKTGAPTWYDLSSFVPTTAAPPTTWRVGLRADVNMTTYTGGALNDLVLYVPITGEIARTYCIEITSAGEVDKFRWGWWNGGGWTWVESDLEIAFYEQTLENDITVTFGAVTGHTVGSAWTFTYPQPTAKVYEIVLCGGDVPVTVADVLQTCAEVARVPVELPTTTTYILNQEEHTYPVQTYIDGEVAVSVNGAVLQIFDENHELEIGATHATFAGVQQNYPELTLPGTLRVVGNSNILSLHCGGHVLAAWYYKILAGSGRIRPVTGATYTVKPLNWPVDETWWDFNQAASSVLERILDRRRVYLFDDPDGVLRVTTTPDRTALISTDYPVGGRTSYERAISRVLRTRDARDIISVVQIIGDGSPGSRVAMLDPQAAQYGARSSMQDNPWVASELDALHEARMVLNDSRRALETRQVEGFWDPALLPGSVFTLMVDGVSWTGFVQEFRHELTMDDKMVTHNAQWSAKQMLTMTGYGQWVANDNTPDIVVPPQVTPGKTKYNQARWR